MVYPYTKPRGPIAAMYSSPGPCYALPGLVGQPRHDPRSVHNKGPAYPFGVRHGKFADDCSPGPAYLPNSKIFKDGMDGTPHYSLYGRKRDLTRSVFVAMLCRYTVCVNPKRTSVTNDNNLFGYTLA